MNWRAAARVWRLPVVWVAADEEPAAVTATATVVHVYVVPGTDAGGVMAALSAGKER